MGGTLGSLWAGPEHRPTRSPILPGGAIGSAGPFFVAETRVERAITAHETVVIPFHYSAVIGCAAMYDAMSAAQPFLIGIALFCSGLGLGLQLRARHARPAPPQPLPPPVKPSGRPEGHMTTAQIILAYVNALKWPAVAALAIVLYRSTWED